MNYYDGLWLKSLTKTLIDCDTPLQAAQAELADFFRRRGAGERFELSVNEALGEGYCVERTEGVYHLSGGNTGILYGAYDLIRELHNGGEAEKLASSPRYPLRMLNSWDNMDGTVERGYSGRSIWFEGNRFDYDPERIRYLGRLLASAHINVLCVNNVNVHAPAQRLLTGLLPDLASFAALLRPFGVRLMVSIDFSLPLSSGLQTADPLAPEVQAFWDETARGAWTAIPDLAGFLVKADSEHRPGPNAYGRTHAEGANMLGRAVKPYGGVVVWRAFVYDCLQDWRNVKTDRPCAAYQIYQPLDGDFVDNVILQIKNGPFDFQVREPVSSLLLSMQNTNTALEVQLAQEYTGQQIDLYAMPPMWKEIFDVLPAERIQAIAAVSNLGRDYFWTGHPFAAVNLYAFGRLAWDPAIDPAAVIDEWIRLTYTMPDADREKLLTLLLNSRHVYELYTATLGLCWMITPHTHYGPNPDGYEYDLWGTYHRADRNAVGIDRTALGTGYTAQYPPELQAFYENRETCPDELLLFFHRVAYDARIRDGRTLIQRIYDDHFEGCAEAEKMAETLQSLPLPETDRQEAVKRMAMQLKNAREWRDVVNTFFYRFSGVEDEQGRTIYP